MIQIVKWATGSDAKNSYNVVKHTEMKVSCDSEIYDSIVNVRDEMGRF